MDRQVQHDLSGDPSSKKEAAIQRKLKAAEDITTMFARIGSMRKEKSGSLNYLDIPTDPDDKPKAIADQPEKWTRLTVPKDIEEALQAHFRRHFGQAQGTPFTVPPLSSQIDFSASTHTAEMILDGSTMLVRCRNPPSYSSSISSVIYSKIPFHRCRCWLLKVNLSTSSSSGKKARLRLPLVFTWATGSR